MATLVNSRETFLFAAGTVRVTGAYVNMSSGTATSFVLPKNTTQPVPAAITLTATPAGYITPAYTWSYRFGNSGAFTSLAETSDTLTITYDNTFNSIAGTNTLVQYRVQVSDTTYPSGINSSSYTLSIPILREGNDGAAGVSGTRGSRQLYSNDVAYTSTYTYLSNAAGAASYAAKATALIATATAGTNPTTPIEGDTVTFTNGSSYVYTITYNSFTASWQPPGTVIDGNLLVTNSVTAAAINGNNLVIRDNFGTPILSANDQLDGSTYIRDLSITNAQIGNIIQSNDYNDVSETGWLVDKTGSATFNNVTARGNITANYLDAATGSFAGELAAGVVSPENLVGFSQEYPNPGTYTVYTMPYTGTVKMYLVGGGGGGANGARMISGNCGSPGQFTQLTLTNVAAGSIIKVTVGSGGAGGASSTSATLGSAGTAGTFTRVTINDIVVATANGGAGGSPLTFSYNAFPTGLSNAVAMRYYASGNDNYSTAYSSSGQAANYSGSYGGTRGGASLPSEIKYKTGNFTALSGGSGIRGGGGGGGAPSAVQVLSGFSLIYVDPIDGNNGDAVPTFPGGAGGNGYAFIQVFNPNAVVLKDTLDSTIETMSQKLSLLSTFDNPFIATNGSSTVYNLSNAFVWASGLSTNSRGVYDNTIKIVEYDGGGPATVFTLGTYSKTISNFTSSKVLNFSVTIVYYAATDDSWGFQLRRTDTGATLASSGTFTTPRNSLTTYTFPTTLQLGPGVSYELSLYGAILSGANTDKLFINSMRLNFLGFTNA